jgi:phosphatidylserine/phosphatidylglycerophosphate/cardiolipin synthase-like enzyme
MRAHSSRLAGYSPSVVGPALVFSLASLVSTVRAQDALPVHSPLLERAAETAKQPIEPDARTGHQVCIVEYPRDALLLRLHLIRAARHSIDLQTFGWSADESSRLLDYELVQASRRGVRVRVIVDGLGLGEDAEFLAFNEASHPNLAFKIYRPPARHAKPGPFRKLVNFMLPNGSNQRMHNKLMVVDKAIGLTGGRNIGNEYFGLSTTYNFKDRDVLVIGPQVGAMTRSFDEYWDFKRAYSNHRLKDVRALLDVGTVRPERRREDVQLGELFGDLDREAGDPEAIERRFVRRLTPVESLAFVADAPGKKSLTAFFNPQTQSRMANYFWNVFYDARDEVLIQSPYVIFNSRSRHKVRKHYRDAPELRVRVSTNSLGAADRVITYAANYRLRTKVILGLEFEVFELRPHPQVLSDHLPGFEALCRRAAEEKKTREPYLSVHAKTFVFDARVTYIGSFNLDPRSFFYNGECGVFIEDESMASRVRQTLLVEMNPDNSWVIAHKQQTLGPANRLLELISTTLPIDPWPLRNTSSFELKSGGVETAPSDPSFYDNYEDIGRFPGAEGLENRRLWTSVFKTLGKAATPLL